MDGVTDDNVDVVDEFWDDDRFVSRGLFSHRILDYLVDNFMARFR